MDAVMKSQTINGPNDTPNINEKKKMKKTTINAYLELGCVFNDGKTITRKKRNKEAFYQKLRVTTI